MINTFGLGLVSAGGTVFVTGVADADIALPALSADIGMVLTADVVAPAVVGDPVPGPVSGADISPINLFAEH